MPPTSLDLCQPLRVSVKWATGSGFGQLGRDTSEWADRACPWSLLGGVGKR